MGLLDSLSVASNALDAEQLGLEVTGQNLANINTVGYTRQTLNLVEAPPVDANSPGEGVQIQSISTADDPLIDRQVRNASAGVQYDAAVVNGLAGLQSAVGQPGSSIDGALSTFFGAYATLAQDPTSASNREVVTADGQQLAAGFQQMSAQFQQAQATADTGVRNDLQQVNQLSQEVAALNSQIAGANGSNTQSLVDQRNVDVGQLTDLTGASTAIQSDGSINVSMANGAALVVGNASYQLTAVSAPVTGYAQIHADGQDITSQVTGGEIGGLLAVRDALVPNYQNQLNQLAYNVSTQVNKLSEAGYTGTGSTGQDFFTPLASATGAASALQVDPAVVSNPNLVVASSTGSAGDNQTAQAIANLATSKIALGGTGTPSDAWAQIVYQVGADGSTATGNQTTSQAVLSQLQTLQSSSEGVSVDYETANLMKYQLAYEASARYFVTIDQTLDSLMTSMGV